MKPTIFSPWALPCEAAPRTYSITDSLSPSSSSAGVLQANNYTAYRRHSVPSNSDPSVRLGRGSFRSDDGLENVHYQTIATNITTMPRSTEVKRARGRPRKYPNSAPDPNAKPAKSRSKTGCWTCRRRKKKVRVNKPRLLIRVCAF